jgi:hypothetical protein
MSEDILSPGRNILAYGQVHYHFFCILIPDTSSPFTLSLLRLYLLPSSLPYFLPARDAGKNGVGLHVQHRISNDSGMPRQISVKHPMIKCHENPNQ